MVSRVERTYSKHYRYVWDRTIPNSPAHGQWHDCIIEPMKGDTQCICECGRYFVLINRRAGRASWTEWVDQNTRAQANHKFILSDYQVHSLYTLAGRQADRYPDDKRKIEYGKPGNVFASIGDFSDVTL